MTESDVIIVGGGAAGLIAAREISKKKKVILFEAKNRLGGRIFTSAPIGFSMPVELGAEFIHGDLPITKSLIKEADLMSYPVEGEIYQVKKGVKKKSEDVIEGLPVLISKVKRLKKDLPFSEFIEKYLNEEEYRDVKESSIRFVEGYDAADIHRASTLALSKEWESEGAVSPDRIEGGYGKMIDFLSAQAVKAGCEVFISTVVKEIRWKKNQVEITTDRGEVCKSQKILVTVPVGVLKSLEASPAHIKFIPYPEEKMNLLNSIGYGAVIKVFFEFKDAFWEMPGVNFRDFQKPGFIITDTIFTAWWTQLPKKIPLLTGWLAGPSVEKMNRNENILLDKAIEALCTIFKTGRSFIEDQIRGRYAANWKDDHYSLGAYSYATVDSAEAKNKLSIPVEDTIFFAGEAFSVNDSPGTVEAAFESGLHAAEKILS
jgi:monoamine oxidase